MRAAKVVCIWIRNRELNRLQSLWRVSKLHRTRPFSGGCRKTQNNLQRRKYSESLGPTYHEQRRLKWRSNSRREVIVMAVHTNAGNIKSKRMELVSAANGFTAQVGETWPTQTDNLSEGEKNGNISMGAKLMKFAELGRCYSFDRSLFIRGQKSNQNYLMYNLVLSRWVWGNIGLLLYACKGLHPPKTLATAKKHCIWRLYNQWEIYCTHGTCSPQE